jgi:hypothetical protein
MLPLGISAVVRAASSFKHWEEYGCDIGSCGRSMRARTCRLNYGSLRIGWASGLAAIAIRRTRMEPNPMKKIATLTMNPTIDVSYTVRRMTPTHKMRTLNERHDPGGGGINVARVFVRLGGDARCY